MLEFNSVQAARASGAIPAGTTMIRTLGFYNPGDRGGATWIGTSSPPYQQQVGWFKTGTAGNYVYWTPTESILNARMLGAYGDGSTEDEVYLLRAFQTAVLLGRKLYIDDGVYLFKDQLNISGSNTAFDTTDVDPDFILDVEMSKGAFLKADSGFAQDAQKNPVNLYMVSISPFGSGNTQSVRLRGGNFDMSEVNYRTGDGLHVAGGTDIRIEDVDFFSRDDRRASDGDWPVDTFIQISSLETVSITGCTFRFCQDTAIYISGVKTGDNPQTFFGQDLIITGNFFYGCSCGAISKRSFRNTLVDGNMFHDCTVGIATGIADDFPAGKSLTIASNDFYGTGVPIQIQFTDGCKVEGNRAWELGKFSGASALVALQGSSDCTIENNQVFSTYVQPAQPGPDDPATPTTVVGVSITPRTLVTGNGTPNEVDTLYPAQRNTVSNNVIKGATTGIVSSNDPEGANHFYYNRLIGCAVDYDGLGAKDRVDGVVANLADNAGFSNWQAGTLLTGQTAIVSVADRFWVQRGASGSASFDVSRQAYTGGNPAGTGPYYHEVRIADATGLTRIDVYQRFPDPKSFSGKQLTIRWRARATRATGTPPITWSVVPAIVDYYPGTGGSGAPASTVAATATMDNGSWTWFTTTITVPDLSGMQTGTDPYLQVRFRFSGCSNSPLFAVNDLLDIDALQVVVNGFVDGLIMRDPLDDLAACLRYYEKVPAASINGSVWIPCASKRSVPAVTATAGTIVTGTPTTSGAVLQNSATAQSTLTFDARL